MNGAWKVDFVENSGQRCGFTGTGCAGDKHEAGFFLGDLLENFREFNFSSVGITALSWRPNGRKIPTLRKKTLTRKRALSERA